MLLTLEGKPITSNRFLRPFRRLPGPYTFHLVLYAALIVFWAVIIVLDARMYITARSLYGQLGRLLGIIDSLLAGSFTAAMIGDATMLGTSVTSLSTTLVRRNDDILIAFLVMGTIAVALYLPFAFTLVHQLRQLAVGAKQRSAMSIGVQSHRDAQQVYAHRSILVAVHAILCAPASFTVSSF